MLPTESVLAASKAASGAVTYSPQAVGRALAPPRILSLSAPPCLPVRASSRIRGGASVAPLRRSALGLDGQSLGGPGGCPGRGAWHLGQTYQALRGGDEH